MALTGIKISLGQSLGNGLYQTGAGGGSAPDFSGISTNVATLATDIATLVSDGASPTQAHVNAVSANFGVVNAAYMSLVAACDADMTVIIDGSKFTKLNQLKAAFQRALQAAMSGIGGLT